MATKVIYKQGLKATYLALPDRSTDTLYFCTDTQELFKGDDLYTDGLRVIDSFADLPSFEKAADQKLYYCADSGCGYVLNSERTAWVQVIYGVDGDTLEINADGLLQIKTVPVDKVGGLDKFVSNIVQKAIGDLDTELVIATKEQAGAVKPDDSFDIAADGTLSLNNIPASKIANLSPVATAAINPQQMGIDEGVLSIIDIDSSLVSYRGASVESVLDKLEKTMLWEDFDS